MLPTGRMSEVNLLLVLVGILAFIDDAVSEEPIALRALSDALKGARLNQRQVRSRPITMFREHRQILQIHLDQAPNCLITGLTSRQVQGLLAHAVEKSHGIDDRTVARAAAPGLEVVCD